MSRFQHVRNVLHRFVPQKPWIHWFAVYLTLLLYFFFSRMSNVSIILDMYADNTERGVGLQLLGIMLGTMEDVIVVTYLCLFLLLLKLLSQWISSKYSKLPYGRDNARVQFVWTLVGRCIHLIIVLLYLVIAITPFAVDTLMIHTRKTRFTFDLIAMYIRDKAEVSTVKLDESETNAIKRTITITAIVIVLYGLLYVGWIDLTLWILRTRSKSDSLTLDQFEVGNSTTNEAKISPKDDCVITPNTINAYQEIENKPTTPKKVSTTIQSLSDEHGTDSTLNVVDYQGLEEEYIGRNPSKLRSVVTCCYKGVQTLLSRRLVRIILISLVMLLIFPTVFLSITHVMSVSLANLALNTTLNEIFFAITKVYFLPNEGEGTLALPLGNGDHPYIHSKTETFTLLGQPGSLYRTTTGFKGPLAFNMNVDPSNPPNVLVIMVESFRARDSLYLSGETSAGALLKQHNISITPNFDRWAKRGIAFNNTWSSLQTSRSIESMNYAQLPYDDPDSTGTSGGRTKTKLAGMPQFFIQKGYDVSFSAGSRVDYDGWELFLPAHGYEKIVSTNDYKQLAMKTMGLTSKDFTNGKTCNSREMSWGVHDDISFSLFGDALIEKIKAQQFRVQTKQPKQPFFITHYTISSHAPFDCVPQWFRDEMEKTGELKKFDVVSANQQNKDLIDAYTTIRYFTDIQLGLFLDRMKKEGVLDDTIVVIAGDHGHSPEYGLSTFFEDQQSTTHIAAAMIAEGHLSKKDRGLIISDAVEQYDFLNTLADIVGVPPAGFQQVGAGRSLKRKVPFGDRLVYSNNPVKKMSIVRGTRRFVFDRTSKAVSMHDIITDDQMKIDLFPTLSKQEQEEWLARRDAARGLNSYYKNKMDSECVAETRC